MLSTQGHTQTVCPGQRCEFIGQMTPLASFNQQLHVQAWEKRTGQPAPAHIITFMVTAFPPAVLARGLTERVRLTGELAELL